MSDKGFIDVPGGRVFYREVGGGDRVPVLCLHGGPGYAHDYLDPLEDLGERRRVIFYDQLGCGRSDRPDDADLWVVDRFVEELVAVREALDLERLHLFGSSWGGMLAMQYALDRRPDLVSIVNSSGPASIPQWEINTRRLLEDMPDDVRASIERHEANEWYGCPEYTVAVLRFYKEHVCRLDPWPEGLERSIAGLNPDIYMHMQGPSEFTIVGTLKTWDIMDRLHEINTPMLLTCGRHDECLPDHMEDMHGRIPRSKLLVFENSSHMQYHEERSAYMVALNHWFDEVEVA